MSVHAVQVLFRMERTRLVTPFLHHREMIVMPVSGKARGSLSCRPPFPHLAVVHEQLIDVVQKEEEC